MELFIMVPIPYPSIKDSEIGLNLSSTRVRDFGQQIERFAGISVSTINYLFSRAVALILLTQGMLDSV